MKKVLLVTYYFDPANSVGTPRMASWAKEFSNSGLHTTVVTRHWKGDEANWADFLEENTSQAKLVEQEGYSIHYLPYKNYIPDHISKNKLMSKGYHLTQFLSGSFSPEVNAHHAFKEFCRQLLKKEKFDVILVSAPPLNLVRLASELGKEFNIPFSVDFRDIWNNSLTLQGKDSRNMRLRFMNNVEEHYIKKWLRNCVQVTSVSPALISEIKRIYNGNVQVITNGFEDYLFKPIRQSKPESAKFTLSSIGTIYLLQDISVFIEGLKQIYNEVSQNNDFQLNLIGINAVPEVARILEKELHMFKPVVTERIPRKQLSQYYKDSHVLFIPAWKNYKGIYTSKIFEYIGSGRTILAAPGDGDVVDELITQTETGYIANTADEFAQIVMKKYHEWRKQGFLTIHPNEVALSSYSRENQAAVLAKSLLSVIK